MLGVFDIYMVQEPNGKQWYYKRVKWAYKRASKIWEIYKHAIVWKYDFKTKTWLQYYERTIY